MNRNSRNRATHPDEEKEKKENNAARIQHSSTCRRLFWGADDPIPTELSKEAKEEQRLRWNFDFMTETPLPGRYQWERTDANGHVQIVEEEKKTNKRSRSPAEAQCPRPEKQLQQQGRVEGGLHLDAPAPPTYGVDCT